MECRIINGVEVWFPTQEEVAESVRSSLSHSGLGLHYGCGATPQEQANRVENLNRLYVADGRDKPWHPEHLLNTGLMEKMEAGAIGDLSWGKPDVFEVPDA